MSNPSEQLAIKVIERLITKKILLPGDGKKMLQKMAEGKLRGEDWRLLIEKAAEKETKVQK
jgi:hypothetical protein